MTHLLWDALPSSIFVSLCVSNPLITVILLSG